MASIKAPLEFVVIDPATNLKPGKSLQIRSRCMLGQNKRGSSRRTQREQRKASNKPDLDIAPSNQAPIRAQLPPPNTLISDLAQYQFAHPGIDAQDKCLLFKAFAYNFANQSLSPLERCVDFDCLESAAFEWVFQDAAFLHSVLCTSYAIQDFTNPDWDGMPGCKTSYHLREALLLLQAKMGQPGVHQDEAVLLVVINLALLSAIYGDWWAAAAHYKGLHKIVQLRGSLAFLQQRPQLHFKLDRIDLAYTLSSGEKPFFLHPSVSWDPIIPPPYLPLPEDLYPPSPAWDYRLASVFQDFQYLALRINRNYLKKVTHNPACFQATLTSLQSRLVHLGDIVTTPMEELVRLTMLALMTTCFKTPGRKIPYKWAIRHLEEVYQEVMNEGLLQYDTSLRFWVLLTITYTITEEHPKWVQKAWRETEPGLTWQNVRGHLMRVMWIELVGDVPGEAMFQKLEELR